MKICTNCQLEYDDKFAFCKKCGTKLEIKEEGYICHQCGKTIKIEDEFCPYCGTSVMLTGSNATNPIVSNNTSGTSNINDTGNEKTEKKISLKSIITMVLVILIVSAGYLYSETKNDETFKYKLYDLGILNFLGKEEQYRYANKLDEEKKYSEAFKWYLKSAESGFAPAQNNLGAMYENGEGVSRDVKAAFKWYLKAAEQGHHYGQCNVGLCYYYGTGVQRDENKAREWLRKARNNGSSRAYNVIDKLKLDIPFP